MHQAYILAIVGSNPTYRTLNKGEKMPKKLNVNTIDVSKVEQVRVTVWKRKSGSSNIKLFGSGAVGLSKGTDHYQYWQFDGNAYKVRYEYKYKGKGWQKHAENINKDSA
jgi:hypothetical protein